MKNIYIVVFSVALMACSKEGQIENVMNKESEKINISNTVVENEKIIDINELKNKKDASSVSEGISKQLKQAVSCSTLNVDLFGFNESSEEPECNKIAKINLNSYKCDISKNAFGSDHDVAVFEANEQRIFVLPDLKTCNEILEIRNSNAP